MILFVFIFFLSYAVRCENNYYVIQMPEAEAPPNNRVPLNDPPFEVYWNVPTMQCTSKKILFEDLYKKFGIIQNQGDSFRGDRIAILYDPGIFPAIFKNETSGKLRFRNGGVPQEGDLQKHLEEFRDIMNQSVTDQDFNGIGIIDFESWRPIYRQNFGVLSPYKDVSYDIERGNHWWWPPGMVTAEAKRRFEESARTFMESTLIAAKQLRPLAKWGYYAFPYCFNSKTERCADKVPSENDHISWLWSESTAIYPSVYSSKDLTPYQLSLYVKGRVDEASRARRGRAKGDVPILPYFWFKYRDGGYMREEDLQTVLKTFDNSDASGFIIWGSSNDVNTVEKCLKLLNYMDTVLGPAVAKYTKTKRNIHGVGEDIFNSTGTDNSDASDIYDIVTENYSVHNKTDLYSLVNVVNYNNKNENDTKVQFNGNDNDTKTFVDVSNDTVKLNENYTNNSETIKLLNLKESYLNNKTQNKSIFSVYSAVDSTLLDKIAENLFTTETITTEKAYEIEFDEYQWDPPKNYTKDFEEESTKKQGDQNIKYKELNPNNKDNKEQNTSEEISPNTKARTVWTPNDFIYQSLLEYKNKAESILPLKEVVQTQIKKPVVNIYTEPDVNSLSTTKVNNSLENSDTDKSHESKEKHHNCKNCMNKMKEKKKGYSMMLNHDEGGHDHSKKNKDEENTLKGEEKSYVHEDNNSNHHHNKEPDKIVENKVDNYMDQNIKTKHDKEYKDITDVSLILDSDYTTKQPTILSDYVQSEKDDSKINEEEIQVINEMMFPLKNSKKTTNNNFLEVNITAFEIDNVQNRTGNLSFNLNRYNSTEIRQKIKEITNSTEKSIDLLHDILDNTETSSEVTENIMTEITMIKGTEADRTSTESMTTESVVTETTVTESTITECPVTEITVTESTVTESTVTESTATESTATESTITESTITESTVTESTETKNTKTEIIVTEGTITEGIATASNNSTTNVEQGLIENISTLRNHMTTGKENKNTETTTKIYKIDRITLINPKSMTKNDKKGRARNINSFTIKQHENIVKNEEIRSNENNLKNMKKGLPKSKDEYENLLKTQAEKTIKNEEMNTKKGLTLPKLQNENENLMKDELPVLEELVSSDFITEKVTVSILRLVFS